MPGFGLCSMSNSGEKEDHGFRAEAGLQFVSPQCSNHPTVTVSTLQLSENLGFILGYRSYSPLLFLFPHSYLDLGRICHSPHQHYHASFSDAEDLSLVQNSMSSRVFSVGMYCGVAGHIPDPDFSSFS